MGDYLNAYFLERRAKTKNRSLWNSLKTSVSSIRYEKEDDRVGKLIQEGCSNWEKPTYKGDSGVRHTPHVIFYGKVFGLGDSVKFNEETKQAFGAATLKGSGFDYALGNRWPFYT